MKKSKVLLFLLPLFSLFSAPEPPPEVRYDRAAYILSLIHPGAVCAEIGVDSGCFSYHVLLKKNPKLLFLIDPWQYGLQPEIEKDITPENQQVKDQQYEAVCSYFAPFDNVKILRKKSEDVFDLFPEEFFDYVYIDGEHSYEAVTRDLNNYFPKVKPGGYILGDDYGWTGVAPAVQDFLLRHPRECIFLEDPYKGKTGGQFAIRKLR